MRVTHERWLRSSRRSKALGSAVLLAAWLGAACGGDDPAGKDLGARDGGAGDAVLPGGDAAPGDGGRTDGVAAGDLADLVVSWTIDGAADDPAGRCAKYGVSYFSLVVRVDGATGKEVLSQGFLCGGGGWTTGEALHQLPYGPYVVVLTAAAGTCCSGGTTIDVAARKLWLKKGTSTDVTFNLAGGKFERAP